MSLTDEERALLERLGFVLTPPVSEETLEEIVFELGGRLAEHSHDDGSFDEEGERYYKLLRKLDPVYS